MTDREEQALYARMRSVAFTAPCQRAAETTHPRYKAVLGPVSLILTVNK